MGDTIRHLQGWAYLVPNTQVTVLKLPVQPSVPNRGGYGKENLPLDLKKNE